MEFKFFLISLFLVFFKLSEGTTDNLEPCKIYSLPPYYRENCTKSGGVYTSTYSMGLCNDKECKCSYFTCATPTPTQEPTPTTNNLEPCKIYSLPPYYRENCTKSGGVYTSTYSMGLCNDKKCECPYFTCATPTPTQKPIISTKIVPTITKNNLEPCKTYSLPSYYRENCTKSGGVYTSTYSMGLCNDKKCECPYFTCATPTPTQIQNAVETSVPTSKTVPSTADNLEPCKIYSLPPYYRENCTKSGGVYTSTYSMGLCNDKECECPYFTCATPTPTQEPTPTTNNLEPCKIYSLPPYYRENCTKSGGVYTSTYSMGLCNDKECECPYFTCATPTPTQIQNAVKTLVPTSKTVPSTADNLEPCKIYSLPPYYRENCTKSGGVYTSTYSMELCNDKECECSYFTCATPTPTQEPTPTTNNLEPCKIYSLPPYYRESCTKSGGVYTSTYSMGLCNDKECECSYFTCATPTPTQIQNAVKTLVPTSKTVPSTADNLEPCKIYSLPPYYRENCTKSGGVYTSTYSMGLCNDKECECSYFTCATPTPTQEPTPTTNNLEPCKIYSLPPYYRESCTKSGGVYTSTYSMGLCNDKECECSYFTCATPTPTQIQNAVKTLVPTSKTVPSTADNLEPCKIYSLPPYYRENCTKSGGVYTSTYSMGLCNDKECECPYFTCATPTPTQEPTPITNNLEPCKIYSLPPYYRENCTKSGGVYTSTYSMGLCNDKECECPYFTCATPTPTQEPTPITNNLEPCKIYSLPPYYRENCTKSGGVYTSTYSMGLCNDKECECPYFTCATPTPTQEPTPTTNNLEPCKIYSLPPYYRENCTKSGGVYTSTYSMGLCNDKECKCPYFTCAMENTKTTKTITVTKSVPTVTITKATTKTLKVYESEPTNGATTQCAKKWNQCGGIGFNGPTCCESGSTCHELNKYYSQCM